MTQHKLFLLLITALLMQTVVYIGTTYTTAYVEFAQSEYPGWPRQVDKAAIALSILLPTSQGIETPAENLHLFEHERTFHKSNFNLMRLARKIDLHYWSHSFPAKILLYRNPYSFRISQYPWIPITFRKLLI